jgi:hypothetical protein
MGGGWEEGWVEGERGEFTVTFQGCSLNRLDVAANTPAVHDSSRPALDRRVRGSFHGEIPWNNKSTVMETASVGGGEQEVLSLCPH